MDSYGIETRELTKCYGTQTVVDSINIHVKQGKIYGLLGRNGAGKTTVMKMILGITSITKGEIFILGNVLHKKSKSLYSRIGSHIELPAFYPNLTGMENLRVFSKLRGTISRHAEKRALEIVGLPYNDNKVFSKYSLGMKQRLAIAHAITHDPELLILDEPTNGLDPIGMAEMRELLKKLSKEQGKTILISSHILTEISIIADDIGIIHNGALLTEKNRNELEALNKKYVLLRVLSTTKASNILEQKCSIYDYSIENNTDIRIYQTNIDMAKINKTLALENIAVKEVRECNDSLEDYFKKITGGVGIA